jgi:uncharacterized membrane protein
MARHRHLLLSMLFTLFLIGFRMIYTGNYMFAFIVWNTFLAVIPLYFSEKLKTAGRRASFAYAAAWLLFFPNALYIITDLFHLRDRELIPVWYDLVILFSAAINGIIAGFISLYNVEKWLKEKIHIRRTHLFIIPIMLLCAYGIYLGRYERWNSWDIVAQPFALFSEMAHHIFHPFRNKECWLLTLIFGSWMYLLYTYSKRLKRI